MLRLFSALALALFSLSLVTITGCGEDADELGPEAWQGNWTIISVEEGSVEQILWGALAKDRSLESLSAISFNYTVDGSIFFNSANGIFTLTLTMTYVDPFRDLNPVHYEGGKTILELVGVYSVHGDTYTFGPSNLSWEILGSHRDVGLTLKKDVGQNLGVFTPRGTTGSWERQGNRLALTNSYGSTAVLERI